MLPLIFCVLFLFDVCARWDDCFDYFISFNSNILAIFCETHEFKQIWFMKTPKIKENKFFFYTVRQKLKSKTFHFRFKFIEIFGWHDGWTFKSRETVIQYLHLKTTMQSTWFEFFKIGFHLDWFSIGCSLFFYQHTQSYVCQQSNGDYDVLWCINKRPAMDGKRWIMSEKINAMMENQSTNYSDEDNSISIDCTLKTEKKKYIYNSLNDSINLYLNLDDPFFLQFTMTSILRTTNACNSC